ncbi:MAG: Ig-like domain-containing protein [Deltaproteobacteria bacterium]|nr:Ig-like domain-containing protein [Deltaproteobacteria bacterium]
MKRLVLDISLLAMGLALVSCGDPVVILPSPLVVTNTSVNDGGFVDGLKPTLVFSFNNAVTLASVKSNNAITIEAVDAGAANVPSLSVVFPDTAGSATAWQTIEVQPTEDLSPATKYVLTMKSSLIKAEDGSRLETDFLFHFQTE